MGNYFDKERELGLAAKEFNKKTSILENECSKAINTLLDETMFDETPINESAAWYMFKHSPAIGALLEYDYTNKLYARSAKYYEAMTLTEQIVFGEDTGKTERIKNIHNAIDCVDVIKEAVLHDDVEIIVEGISKLIPLYCLFEEEARENIESRLAKAKEEQEEKDKKAEEEQEKSEESEENTPDDKKDEDQSDDDKNDDESDVEKEYLEDKYSEDEEDEKKLSEEYLEEKRRLKRPANVVKTAYKLRKKAGIAAGNGDVESAVELNNRAKALEQEADEVNSKG